MEISVLFYISLRLWCYYLVPLQATVAGYGLQIIEKGWVWLKMSDGSEESRRVKCPYCAEKIMPEALICPFCRTRLVEGAQQQSDGRPGIFRAMFLNLLCPGMGAWKLGHRIRGTVIFCLITASLLVYMGQVMPAIQHKVNQALMTGKTGVLNTLQSDLESNPWMDFAFWLYVLSFFDVYYLIANNSSGNKPGDKT